MIKIQVDLVKFNKDFDVFKNQLEFILKKIAIDFTRDFLANTIRSTKLGDATANLDLYLQRQKEYGYFPVQGLAKGSWVTELNNPSGVVDGVYDTQGTGEASRKFFEPEMQNFNVGDTIYITNRLHYIELDAEGDVAIQKTFSLSSQIFDSVVKKVNRIIIKEKLKPRGS